MADQVSIGAVQADPSQMPSTLIDCADKALYEAKGAGRDRVIFSDGVRAKAVADEAIELFGT